MGKAVIVFYFFPLCFQLLLMTRLVFRRSGGLDLGRKTEPVDHFFWY